MTKREDRIEKQSRVINVLKSYRRCHGPGVVWHYFHHDDHNHHRTDDHDHTTDNNFRSNADNHSTIRGKAAIWRHAQFGLGPAYYPVGSYQDYYRSSPRTVSEQSVGGS